ncbi:SET and MYND domain-containing protein 4 [Pholidichthys leucotaenia]
MDLPSVQWQGHVAHKWLLMEPEEKETFTSLQEIDDVFKYALSLTCQGDLDFLEFISAGYSAQKDPEQATTCRERGNSSFKSRNYTAAALHYSQGVCFAPQSSEQLSLCYANRSAALYHLQHYQECLDDIDKALKNGYPSHLLHKLEDRRALCLSRLSEHEKSRGNAKKHASKNHKGSGGVKAPSGGPLPSGICPQAAVGSSVEKGRHLVAVERIAAGQVILTDRPYSCVLIAGMEEGKGKGKGTGRDVLFGMEDRRCHCCLAETLRPVPCGGCSYSRYCGSGCQQEAWEEHHRWECPLMAELRVMGVMAQLALRTALKAGLENLQMARESVSDPPDSSPSFSDPYPSVYNLLHHLNRHSPALRFLCAITIATLYSKLSKAGPPLVNPGSCSSATSRSADGPEEEGGSSSWNSERWLLGSAALRHMLQLRCNAQAIIARQDTEAGNSPVQSNREVRIATAIFPSLSLLNHSCCPNTSLVFSTGVSVAPCDSSPAADISESIDERRCKPRGVTVTVRAARVISPGQEILHYYGPHSSRMGTKERQRLLIEQYYFLCQCEACSPQQQDEEESSRQWTRARGRPRESGLLCSMCKSSLQKNEEKNEAGFICSSCGHPVSLSEVSHRLQEIKDDLEKAVELMERERPGDALQLLKRTRCQSELIAAQTHPLHGELADATARAYASIGDWKNAASHLEQSVAAITSQFGEDSIELGQQLFKLAQLHFNGGFRAAALTVFPKVRRLLRLHCGPHCHELEELKAMEECLREYT